MTATANNHDIRDNYGYGKVADFLAERISDGSVLSVVSAYFTIYAYEVMVDRIELCEIFDVETKNGEDMSRYSSLLDRAVAVIAMQFGRKNAGNLSYGARGKLADASKQVKHTSDFDLITWLVIK